MSANATMSPSHRAGGPGWCSTRDMRKSREIATENRVESTFVIFLIALSPAAPPGVNQTSAGDCHALRPVAIRGFGGSAQNQSHWCGRPGSNRHGVAPNGFSYPLRLSPPPGRAFGVWTIPSPYPGLDPGLRRCPSSLYTFPRVRVLGGLARDSHLTGFPEFEQFCTSSFPAGTQSFKSVASTSFATPALICRHNADEPDF